MKEIIIIGGLSAFLVFPIYASAQTDSPEKPQIGMNCAMMDTTNMQNNIMKMMSKMGAMMKETDNPAMKEQMQKMQEQMASMMGMMKKMQGGMMGGGMMGGGMTQGGKGADGMQPPAAPAPDDHKSHHPSE